tara:strand:+ start:642 stop:968 length:327 start_codon:yes stop_codon:yes gene_type:complete
MGDSFKKYDEDIQEQIEESLELEPHTISSLHQDINRLQKDISKLYTEELFKARIRISELEIQVKDLEKDNNNLRDQLAVREGRQISYTHSSKLTEDDDDWYTSHGQGD